jgi:hypothetical protein
MTLGQPNERDVNGRGQRNTKSCLEMEYETQERQERCNVIRISAYPWRACAGKFCMFKAVIHRTGYQIVQCNMVEEGWLCMYIYSPTKKASMSCWREKASLHDAFLFPCM